MQPENQPVQNDPAQDQLNSPTNNPIQNEASYEPVQASNITSDTTADSTPAAGTASTTDFTSSRSKKLKRFFLQTLLGSLIGAAVIAVIAVLVGSFNSTFARALGTIAMVALHALLSFGYISESDKRDKEGSQTSEIFGNSVFAIIVLSFITSVFAIWQIISGDLALQLYLFYGVVLFAILHGEVLYRLRGYENRIDTTVYANYVLMTLVVIMLTFLIFYPERSDLNPFFYRLLAALGIIDATATITAIIMHKMFLQKHPELAAKAAEDERSKSKNFWKNPLVVLLLIFLAFQFIGGILGLILGGL